MRESENQEVNDERDFLGVLKRASERKSPELQMIKATQKQARIQGKRSTEREKERWLACVQ